MEFLMSQLLLIILLKDAADMLKDKEYLYNVAVNEGINLTEIIVKADAFLNNQTEIWDRDDLKDALKKVFEGHSNFVCLLGGKSIGKSLTIRNLEQLSMGTVFRVNLREASDILTGLKKVLRERRDDYKFWSAEEAAKRIVKFGSLAAEVARFDTVVTTLTKILENSDVTHSLQALIRELVNSQKANITIIIDEANIAFCIKPETSRDKIEAVREALALFVAMTKEYRKV